MDSYGWNKTYITYQLSVYEKGHFYFLGLDDVELPPSVKELLL